MSKLAEEQQRPAAKPTLKVSLSAQIDEVERELEQRRLVYPRLVSSGKMRQSIADFQTMRMTAVRDTLRWLQENERTIKHRLAP